MAIAPFRCNRQDVVKLLNAAANKEGWGNVITTTTIQNLVAAGLPRELEGRTHFYSVLTLAAFYAKQRQSGEEQKPAKAKELDLVKKREEIRRLQIQNDEREGALIPAEQIISEWKLAGAILNGRAQALVDSLRDEDLTPKEAAAALESMFSEMFTAIESSIEKHTRAKHNEAPDTSPQAEPKAQPKRKKRTKKGVK